MGFKRKLGRAAPILALLWSVAGAAAEPSEPLTITRLADSESKLLVSTSSPDARKPDGSADFSRAVGDALRNQQQSIEAQCQSAQRRSGPIAAQWAWEARCRYRRY
jgi:hypothetical protein